MKDKLIAEILADMTPMLTLSQLEELQRVLTYNLHKVGITESKTPDPQENAGNEGVLEVFISALNYNISKK